MSKAVSNTDIEIQGTLKNLLESMESASELFSVCIWSPTITLLWSLVGKSACVLRYQLLFVKCE